MGYSLLVLIFSDNLICVCITIWAVSFLHEIWRRVKLPKYSKAAASFETNEVVRGLSAAEAAYFVGCSPGEIFLAALLTLVDKGILDLTRDYQKVALNSLYSVDSEHLTPEDRQSYREKAARRSGILLAHFESVLLETIPAGQARNLTDLDVNIWYRYFEKTFANLSGVYDFNKTQSYALQIVQRMNAFDSKHSGAAKYLSGWLAVGCITNTPINKNYRPAWLGPSDDFQDVIKLLREYLSSNR